MSNGNVNKIILVGDLGHDPELRYTPKGNAVLTLSLATSRNFKNAAGEERKETHWHKATVWGKRAESCSRYLVKGSRVFVEGELHMKSWTDKDGNPRKSAEIFVDELRFMGGVRKESFPSLAAESQAPALTQ